MRTIIGKLGNMRKEVDWVIYPSDSITDLVVQSDHRICQINLTAQKGMLSKHCQNGAYFIHLNPLLGATVVTIPSDFIQQCLEAPKQPQQNSPVIVNYAN